MQLGVIFPQTEIGADPKAIRDFAQAAEEMGYAHLIVFDHVLGADTRHYANWQGPYTKGDMFHEPFVLYGYLAAITQRLELVTAVVILGQRQTALVAKQAAEVDVLSGGRLRLGVSIGWNAVEYEALNENFHDRGKRCEEQVAVLRAPVDARQCRFHGRWHHITHAGSIRCQCSVPFPSGWGDAPKRWLSASDAWQTAGSAVSPGRGRPGDSGTHAPRERAAGRDPASIGVEGRISVADNPPEPGRNWRRLGGRSRGHASLRQHHACRTQDAYGAYRRHAALYIRHAWVSGRRQGIQKETNMLTRRHFLKVSAVTVGGYAIAAEPLLAQAIQTDTAGLTAGDVTIKSGIGMIPAYQAHPSAAGKYPVIIVISEIWGVHEYIRDVARRFAKEGFYAIALKCSSVRVELAICQMCRTS